MKNYSLKQAAEPLVKVLAAIQSPKGQVISCSISVGLDVLGIFGCPVASSMSIAKDVSEFLVRLLSGNGIDMSNMFAIAHDLAGFIPVYAQYQSILAFSIDSAQLGNAIEQIQIQ